MRVADAGSGTMGFADGRVIESAGGPLLGPLQLVEVEQRELAGDHPGEGVQRMGDPVLVGHDRNSLECRMMLDQCTEAQLQVLALGDQPRHRAGIGQSADTASPVDNCCYPRNNKAASLGVDCCRPR